MEASGVFTQETLEELLRWLMEFRQTLADFKNGLFRLRDALATEEDAASADSSTRLGRGTCSNLVRPHQIHKITRPHPPYL